MKQSIFVFFFFISFWGAFGQNYILPEGEFMDTVSNQVNACPTRNIYYYSVGAKYPESSATLLQKAQSYLETSKRKFQGEGYITFRFIVDCTGKPMKKVEVLQTDNAYKKIHFDKNLVNELFSFFETLDKWKIVKTKDGNPYAYYSFLTFKIKNGKVVNIIP
jgi:hypothetical protein